MNHGFRPVPQQISEIRNRCPQSIALVSGRQQLSYSQLDDRANQFASRLLRSGVAPGDTVAICLERSFDWIAAALAIMRAGAAYVPLDVTLPGARLRFALRDSGARLVVARAKVFESLQPSILGMDPCTDAIEPVSVSAQSSVPVQSGDLAYVIYTSGTSGEPKGVEITHGNLANLIRWHISTFRVTSDDRASHLLGLGFDAAVLEIWGHLCAGATLCFADDRVRSSPELLRDWIVRERISIALFPSILAGRLMEMKWPATSNLRLLITGGDTLHRGPTVQLPFQLINHYGPTECTVVSSWAGVDWPSTGTPPIGKPIDGSNIYLLDETGRCVPDGTVGEIYISGRGVGRGYRNRPELTKRSFLPDPFSSEPGTNMYRTGDRAIRRSDGALEFRGRLDRQTKIRGCRVELDEVSNLLSRHPSVEFSAVTTHGVGEDVQLIAYVLPRTGVTTPPDKTTLQHYLLKHVPSYMVPSIFVRLRSLPLSHNGKLEFSLLPSPTGAELLVESRSMSPISDLEQKLLSIVQHVLSNDSITVDDSFFLSGGDSLSAVQLLTELDSALGIDLTVNQLVEAPSVRELAALVQSASSDLPNKEVPHVFWVQSSGAIELARAFGDDPTLFSIPLTRDDLDLCATPLSLKEIASRLKYKIEEIQPEGPYVLGGLCLGGILAYEIASQLRSAGRDVRLVVLLNAPNPMCPQACKSLVANMRYIVKRATQIGLRKTLSQGLQRVKWTARVRLQAQTSPHEMARSAATTYDPPKYDGDVLLIEPLQRPPHLNLLSAWQSVVTGRLYVSSIDAHWREILNAAHAHEVVDTIVSHLVH
jgi:amino acid adenylation domain-containing protein